MSRRHLPRLPLPCLQLGTAGAEALDRIFRLQFIVIARRDSTSIRESGERLFMQTAVGNEAIRVMSGCRSARSDWPAHAFLVVSEACGQAFHFPCLSAAWSLMPMSTSTFRNISCTASTDAPLHTISLRAMAHIQVSQAIALVERQHLDKWNAIRCRKPRSHAR